MIKIHLLGGFLVEIEGAAVPPIPSQAARSLFAYLATHRDRPQNRDLLAGTLWPESPESSARRRLSQELWRITTALGIDTGADDLVVASGDTVAFNTSADYWLDVEEFERLADQRASIGDSASSSLKKAIRLYRGEFLPGLYDDWMDAERHRLQRMYAGTLARLISAEEISGRYESALSYATRLALEEPLREGAHRDVMRLDLLLGRTAEAMHQFEVCEAILAEELGTEPEIETRELYQTIAAFRAKGATPFLAEDDSLLMAGNHSVPLVGRGWERRRSLRRLEGALRGQGGFILVEGDEGVGKSRLLVELIGDAQWRGLTPISVTCSRDDMLRPLRLVANVLAAALSPLRARQLATRLDPKVLGEVARLVPELVDVVPGIAPADDDPRNGRQRLRDSLRQSLIALGALGPLALFIDDYHWADGDSAALLADIGEDLGNLPMVFCLSYRGIDARERANLWNSLVEVDTEAEVQRIELRPLETEETRLLVEEILGPRAVDREAVEGLYMETGGNPLFVLETLRAWHDDSVDALAGPATPYRPAAWDRFPLSGGVRQVVSRRLDRLEPEALSLARIVSILPGPATLDMLEAVSSLDHATVFNSIEQLVRKRFLSEDGDRITFSHDMIRKAVLDGVGRQDRIRMHDRVASFLEDSDPESVEALQYHNAQAGNRENAYRYAWISATRAVALGGYESAVLQFEEAARWVDQSDRVDLLLAWEEAAGVVGARDQQQRLLDELDELEMTTAQSIEALQRSARLAASRADYVEAVEKATMARDDALDEGSNVLVGRACLTLGLVISESGRPRDAVEYLEAAVAALAGESRESANAQYDLGKVLAEAQEYEAAVTALTAAAARYTDLGDTFGLSEAVGQLATVRMEMGDVRAAVGLYHEAIAAAQKSGHRKGAAAHEANLGNALYVDGKIGRALDAYQAALDLFDSIGERRNAALLRANRASVRFSVLGDDSVASDVEASLRFFRRAGLAWAQAFCHEHLASLASRAGRSRRARNHCERGLALLAENGHLWVEAHLRRVAAQVEYRDGQLEAAAAHLERAVAICHEIGMKDVLPTLESLAALVVLGADQGDAALDTARSAVANIRPGTEQKYLVWHRLALVAGSLGLRDEEREAALEAAVQLDQVVASLNAKDRLRARSGVPEHVAIIEARQRYEAVRVLTRLPAATAPLGRPLRSDEWIDVDWVVSEPGDHELPAGPARRQACISRLVAQAQEHGAAPRIEDLAEAVDVSVATVRRDLMILRDEGISVPTRGSR